MDRSLSLAYIARVRGYLHCQAVLPSTNTCFSRTDNVISVCSQFTEPKVTVHAHSVILIMPYPRLVIAMGAVMPIVDGFFVGLRLFTKQRKTRYGLDDYLIILALVRLQKSPSIYFPE